MPVSGFMVIIPFILMIGSITLFIMFVLAHRKMAKAHVDIAQHLSVIANKMKAD